MTMLTEKLNGRLRLYAMIAGAAIFLITTTITVENRYAKASEVDKVAQATQTILDVIQIQTESRLAVLQLKVANGTITPEQKVELANIKRAIAKMQ
jgi:hypothetical protein